MFQSLSRSWALIKASAAVLRSDPELLILPFISMIGVALASAVFFIPMAFTGLLESLATEGTDSQQTPLGVAILFLFYLVTYTVVIYCNTAVVGAALMRLRGQDPTVGDGLRIANSRIGKIVGYAAISATVGVILSMIRDRDNIIGNIIASIINIAWNVVTFLVVPVLVVEDVGPIEAIKRSGGLLRRTWGEQVVANAGIGLVMGLLTFGLAIVVGAPLFMIGVSTDSFALIMLAVVLVILIVAVLSLFSTALNGVFQAALYNYASTGRSGELFDEALVRTAFKVK